MVLKRVLDEARRVDMTSFAQEKNSHQGCVK